MCVCCAKWRMPVSGVTKPRNNTRYTTLYLTSSNGHFVMKI